MIKRIEKATTARRFTVAGLFAGIGGLELGLAANGHETRMFCELDPSAAAVLASRFPGIPNATDVRELRFLPRDVTLLAGGFPCQDLSQAGETRGISGARSGLVTHVFRLLEKKRVPWVLLENVPFMLQLGRGAAVRFIADEFERLGYRWAYRVIDSRSFGLPQRRQRVFFLASRDEDPARILFLDNAGDPPSAHYVGRACGFYWTEGTRGLGWAVDAVPTLKGGSGLGIPSPPAIWFPDGRIVTPDIRDAERLQGFHPDWTAPAETVDRHTYRWRLVGNAVTVQCATWVASLLTRSPGEIPASLGPMPATGAWPRAAFGSKDGRASVDVSTFPVCRPIPPIAGFLKYPTKLLSYKATSGFTRRLKASSLRYPTEFLHALESHMARMANPSLC